MYYYHDIEKDRPGKKSSALILGSLMDGVINDILLGKCTDPRSRISLEIAKVINEDMDFFPDDFDFFAVDFDFLLLDFDTVFFANFLKVDSFINIIT